MHVVDTPLERDGELDDVDLAVAAASFPYAASAISTAATATTTAPTAT
jgi:hypothetical protein